MIFITWQSSREAYQVSETYVVPDIEGRFPTDLSDSDDDFFDKKWVRSFNLRWHSLPIQLFRNTASFPPVPRTVVLGGTTVVYTSMLEYYFWTTQLWVWGIRRFNVCRQTNIIHLFWHSKFQIFFDSQNFHSHPRDNWSTKIGSFLNLKNNPKSAM